MKLILYFVIGYVVLYAAVWLHEIGHSIFDYKFGCKENWIKVQVKPYIFFSTPGGVYLEEYLKMKPVEHVLSAYGGIMSNMIFACFSGLVLKFVPIDNMYLSMAFWLFMTLHIGEIVSYLFIGSIYLVSDMQEVVKYMPKLRIPNIILGAAIAVIYVTLLRSAPGDFRTFVIIWNVITVLSMCMGRIVFTVLNNRKNSIGEIN